MSLIDFHTHILPCLDDGSKSVEESMEMLKSMAEQGVKTILATPHFYANDESVEAFIQRRNASYERLMTHFPEAPPQMILGAEVRYYDGISRLENLKKLRIEGTKFLLLEMPFRPWTEYAVKEIIDIANGGKITLVLAHVERYPTLQKREVVSRLLQNGVLFQTNVSHFTSFFSRANALKMLRNNQLHFIGSDCHNMTDRPPNIQKAIIIMKQKYGEDFASAYVEYSTELFIQNQMQQ